MSKNKRAPFVAVTTLLRCRFPDLDDFDDLIRRGLVLVNEAPVFNPQARVRADASLRLLRDAPLRGTIKLAYALRGFALDIAGLTALDLGAAAGGFTRALLDAGAHRVYAVDAGVVSCAAFCERIRAWSIWNGPMFPSSHESLCLTWSIW